MSGRPKAAPEALRAPLPPAPEPLPFADEDAGDGEPAGALSPRILTPRTGFVVGLDQGLLLVDYPGNTRGPLAARSTVPLDARTALEAASSRRGALLVFEDGDPGQPILIGLHQPPVGSMIDFVLEEADSGGAVAEDDNAPRAAPLAGASVDGKRVLLEGEEEVTLRCGEASITLRRDGRVVVRGAYVETHASGTNRIKGGSVRIN